MKRRYTEEQVTRILHEQEVCCTVFLSRVSIAEKRSTLALRCRRFVVPRSSKREREAEATSG